MALGRKKGVIGLDIGSSSIKAAELKETKKGYFLENFGMEPAPGLDTLLDQKIGTAGVDLNVGGAFNGTAVQMRCNLGVMGLGHAGNLFGFQNAAHPSQGHLQDVGRL